MGAAGSPCWYSQRPPRPPETLPAPWDSSRLPGVHTAAAAGCGLRLFPFRAPSRLPGVAARGRPPLVEQARGPNQPHLPPPADCHKALPVSSCDASRQASLAVGWVGTWTPCPPQAAKFPAILSVSSTEYTWGQSPPGWVVRACVTTPRTVLWGNRFGATHAYVRADGGDGLGASVMTGRAAGTRRPVINWGRRACPGSGMRRKGCCMQGTTCKCAPAAACAQAYLWHCWAFGAQSSAQSGGWGREGPDKGTQQQKPRAGIGSLAGPGQLQRVCVAGV
jgi:hypothetical protein